MGKFVGFKCDVCGNAEDGNDPPVNWHRLRLPSNGADNARDLCSDKCLLKFARERHLGVKNGKAAKASRELLDFLTERGVKPHAKGALFGTHVRRRHELVGAVGDCLVCEWMTTEKGE